MTEEKEERSNFSPRSGTIGLTKRQIEDFYIRADYDYFKSLAKFVRICIEAYLDNDPDMYKCLTRYREKHNISFDNRRKKSLKLLLKGKEQEENFQLTDDEVESIYDFLENDDEHDWISEEELFNEGL